MHPYEFKGATQRMESDIMRMISVHTGKRGDGMKIGLIGAGKMGCTLGKHMTQYVLAHGSEFETAQEMGAFVPSVCVMGYYSRNPESAKQAAQFTDTKYYESMEALVEVCDVIFITVPDGQIAQVVHNLSQMCKNLKEKILIRTSGALSSQVFSDMDDRLIGYSIHPLYAVNSKWDSYIEFPQCFVTIEGPQMYRQFLEDWFRALGHPVKQIGAEDKAKYHAGAVFASNLVVGLYHQAAGLLMQCGFEAEEAQKALMPLFMNNAQNMERVGCEQALTGPVARGDSATVQKHLGVLSGRCEQVYRLLSEELLYLVADKTEGHRDIQARLEGEKK